MPGSFMKGVFPPDGTVHHLAAAIGVLTLVAIVLWNRFRPQALKVVPGTLVGVVLATVLTAALQLPIQHVQIPDNIFGAFSLPDASSFGNLLQPYALLAAVAIALVASAETLLSAAAVDRMHTGPRTNFDKELSAQGTGNLLCGLIGALPMTGVIVRSSANIQAGAKTRLSAILHGVWLLAFIMLFPSVLRLIPTASLAAILVFTGFKLVEFEHIHKLRHYGRMPVLIYLATIIGIVTTDLLTGVLIGLGLSLVKLLSKATQLSVELEQNEWRADIRLSGVATFLRLPKLAAAFDSIPSHKVIHVHVDHLYYIDHTCLDMLRTIAKQREELGGSVEAPWEVLSRRYHLNEPVRV
jgi:MFS superfamily sulfate permease-like transporter